MIPGLGRSSGEGIGYSLEYYWASQVAQMIKNLPAGGTDLGFIPGLGKSPGEGTRLPTAIFLPIEFHGPGSLTGYIPCGCKELDNE